MSGAPLFRSVLIANRGEIAVRVMHTCRQLGIHTIAVYSDADARALHVREADEAWRLGPPPAAESYLNQAAILAVTRESGAEAIHPGYGFLSENAAFARACQEAGFVWIGPPPEAMLALGDKARAKALAERVGVPLLPGYHGEDQSPDLLRQEAERIGYPVLIKASAGGGGRGMRVVEQPDEFDAALEAARREALASFGDERVLLERYVRRPRHVEMQIFGDQHGNLVYLGERECSIQRRHQKLIEEAPSVAVDDDLRRRMGEAALALAREAGYQNAGTVEFLLDEQRQFAFLEVNARLQVEHPVTEFVTGLDLVEWQLRVAAGEPLPLTQADVRLDGHAIEVRIIAEDPLTGFLPVTGTIERFRPYDALRNEVGVAEASVVSPYYDSLLAKAIAHGPDRQTALELLVAGLDKYEIEGVKTNLDLLSLVVQTDAFRAGKLHTGFLDEHHVLDQLRNPPAEVVAAAACAAVCHPASRIASGDPWQVERPWRFGSLDMPCAWLVNGVDQRTTATLNPDRHGASIHVGSEEIKTEYLGSDSAGIFHRVRPGTEQATVVLPPTGGSCVRWAGRTYRLRALPPLEADEASQARAADTPGELVAPMPGRVVKVTASEGQRVGVHQPLLVLEAMKMEHVIAAPGPATVEQVHVTVGDQVTSGAPLVSLTPD